MGPVVNGTVVKVKTGGQTNQCVWWWVPLGSASIPRLTEHVLLPTSPYFWLLLSSSFSSVAVVELSFTVVAAHLVCIRHHSPPT